MHDRRKPPTGAPQPASRSLPAPDHPGLTLAVDEFGQAARGEYDDLMRSYWRFMEWQAELLNRETREHIQVYCEELEKWRHRVEAFRRKLADEC